MLFRGNRKGVTEGILFKNQSDDEYARNIEDKAQRHEPEAQCGTLKEKQRYFCRTVILVS